MKLQERVIKPVGGQVKICTRNIIFVLFIAQKIPKQGNNVYICRD